jgi:ATP/maltotriose-dependent transcriptional regulator MalT
MFDEAETSIRASRATFAELDQPLAFEIVAGGDLEARIHLLQGDLTHAQEALERSYAVLRQHGDRSYLPTRAARLAEVLAQRGERGEARQWLDKAKAGSTPSDVMTEWLWRLAESKLLIHSGDSDEAERIAREAIAITDQTDTVNYQADCRVALADVLADAGRVAETKAALREALALYENKGNDVASRQTRARLDWTTKSP